MTQELLNTIQTGVLIPIITAIGVGLSILIKVGFDLLLEKVKEARLKKYVGMAMDAVITAVNSTNQQFVDILKLKGEFSEASYAEAFEMAKDTAKNLINENVEVFINEAYKDFDVWLDSQILSVVRKNKLTLPVTTVTVVTPTTVECPTLDANQITNGTITTELITTKPVV